MRDHSPHNVAFASAHRKAPVSCSNTPELKEQAVARLSKRIVTQVSVVRSFTSHRHN
jgi:hypothetical protein